MKALHKDYLREIKTRKGQFLSIFLIVLIGAAFFSGIRSGRSAMEYTANRYFVDNKFMDIHITCSNGLSNIDVEGINEIEGVSDAYPSFSMEAYNNIDNTSYTMKVLAYNENVNTPIIKKGRILKNKKECMIDEEYAKTTGAEIGDYIKLELDSNKNIDDFIEYDEYKVVGIINMPQYLAIDRGSASIGKGSIDNFIVLQEEVFKYSDYTDIYVIIDEIKVSSIFDDKYMDKLEDITNKIIQLGIQKSWIVTNRDDNEGFHDYIEESKRVDSIGKVFPMLFFIIAALITLTSMTRIVEDGRQQIGILKAIGYTEKHIFLRYISFSLLPTLLGSIIGVLFGEKFLPYIIMDVFYVLYTGNENYYMPYNLKYGLFAIIACVVSTLIATTIACKKVVETNTCELMKTKAPSYTNRLWFESVQIWQSLKFSIKSSVRNLLRYKKRLIMTIVGIGGCMGLIVVACGLNDSIKVIPNKQFKEIIRYDVAAILGDNISKKEENTIFNKIKNIDNIDSVVKAFGGKVILRKEKSDLQANLIIPSNNKEFEKFITFRDRKTKEIYNMPSKGCILSEKAAKLLDVKVGDTISLDIDDEIVEVKIKYITESYLYHYIYMSKEQYEILYGRKMLYNQILGVYNDNKIHNIVKFNEDISEEVAKAKGVLGVTFMQDMVDETNDMVEALNAIVYILLISAALLTLVVIYNLNSINIRETFRISNT